MVITSTAVKSFETENGAHREMSSYQNIAGKRLKMERWEYENGQIYVDKYFTADSIAERTVGEEAFKKDSMWIYRDESGDTLKIEKYKNN